MPARDTPTRWVTVHGGILCDVADAAMGIAFVITLRPDESFTTMSLTIDFFRPVWEARLQIRRPCRQSQQEHRLCGVRRHGSRG